MFDLPRAFPRIVIKKRAWIAATWMAVAIALVPEARHAKTRLEVAARVQGSEAAAVQEELAERFHSPFVHRVVLVLKGVPPPDSPEGRDTMVEIVNRVISTPGVTGALSFLNTRDPVFLGKGGSFLIVGLDPGRMSLDALIPRLREMSESLRLHLRHRYPTAELGWTGEILLNFDLRRVSSEDVSDAEKRILPLTLVLLLFAFGTFVAALLPITVGVLAILMTLGASAFLARQWHLSILVQNLASMLGLGLGIDYALLTVSRFRESLASGRLPAEAAEESLRRAGHTLLLSAFPVIIGFAALLTVPVNELQSIGVAGILVTGFSLLLSVTLLPGCLAWIGRRVDTGRVFRRTPLRGGEDPRSEKWRRWGFFVTSHAPTALALAAGPLLLLAWQARRLELVIPRGDWLPPRAESVRAFRQLTEMGRENVFQSLRIVLDLPSGLSVTSPEGWAAVTRFSKHLQEDPDFERVHSLPLLTRGNPMLVRRMPDPIRNTFVSDDGHATLVEAVPATRLSPSEQVDLVRKLRAASAATLTGLAGTTLRVGGLPAFNADYEGIVVGRFSSVLFLVIAGSLVALFVGFRSVLVPLKAVALNLLSVGASFGAVVLVFQEGHGANLIGLDGPTGGVFPIVPILVFCIVFGLSMDYEVILVARVREARQSGMEETAAIAEGLARTGSVITSAAAIMVVVFAGFALGGFLLVKMLGFALAVAVLLDALVVRTVIGPAFLQLAGKWNWWPGGQRIPKRRRVSDP